MAKHVHHIERIKFAISFDVPGADQIGLMNVVEIERLGEIRILYPFGDVASFF
jgi:hypothetical protein